MRVERCHPCRNRGGSLRPRLLVCVRHVDVTQSASFMVIDVARFVVVVVGEKTSARGVKLESSKSGEMEREKRRVTVSLSTSTAFVCV